jgi:hypothetical protein
MARSINIISLGLAPKSKLRNASTNSASKLSKENVYPTKRQLRTSNANCHWVAAKAGGDEENKLPPWSTPVTQ